MTGGFLDLLSSAMASSNPKKLAGTFSRRNNCDAQTSSNISLNIVEHTNKPIPEVEIIKIIFYILYFIFYILYFIFYILYFIFYILYFIFYILYFI